MLTRTAPSTSNYARDTIFNPVVQLEGAKAKKHAEHLRLVGRSICAVFAGIAVGA